MWRCDWHCWWCWSIWKDDEEHDWWLHKLMTVSQEQGLAFNGENCTVIHNSVKFFWCVYDKDSIHPDLAKVSAVKEMSALQSPRELQSFLGMVTYLAPFMPSLSTHTAPLWELLTKDMEYTWKTTYQETFDKLRSLVCNDTTLQYFDVKKSVTIQVDTSKKGLGASLLQDDGPVAFASKALTPTEKNYVSNEHKLLACVFGLTASALSFLDNTLP